ncbi:sugar transferase [Chitinophaga horti]|uniref:Sugar transferase n=1 Tax=Chitinophaga horti TaxID=2920382 RepID=A0ABY6J6G7_9BACT|nr:sugar transferase [Chitinophaga horti]UYQ95233.1 sugar transferase [Chitinophaga horti]
MLYNVPLHLQDQKRKPLATMISLPSDSLMRFALFIGDSSFQKHFFPRQEEETVIATTAVNARKVLKDKLQNSITPAYIICHLQQSAPELQGLLQFLQQNKHFRKIPFFLYTEGLSAGEKQQYARLGGIDDIITPATTAADFNMKLQFARKFRQLSTKADHAKKGNHPWYEGKDVNYLLKRLVDITAAGTALMALSPVLAVIAVAIKLESKGPIFYISKRAGSRYKVFKFYKFRTMCADADKKVQELSHLNQYDTAETEKGPVFFKLSNDPRVTKLGAFLRNTSLDELPQLLNVIKGDMSLVGNRPLPLYEAATLTTDQYAGRFNAPAGLTGLWQIKKRGQKEMSVNERIGLDIDYAEKYSFMYDMWIMAQTPKALIQKDNV